jgi:MOSC domain-containing protein YiiM
MEKQYRDLGHVLLTQIQPKRLIIKTPSSSTYDPSILIEVPALYISKEGIEAVTPAGERTLDVHHAAHPNTRYKGENDVSIGFTAHYDVMREKFGSHMTNGIAGENILVEYNKEVWLDDLGGQIAIENQETGEKALLDVNKYATPCKSFSHFAAKSEWGQLSADKLKDTLDFLGNGRRGFYLSISEGQETVTVRPGDRVYTVAKT